MSTFPAHRIRKLCAKSDDDCHQLQADMFTTSLIWEPLHVALIQFFNPNRSKRDYRLFIDSGFVRFCHRLAHASFVWSVPCHLYTGVVASHSHSRFGVAQSIHRIGRIPAPRTKRVRAFASSTFGSIATQPRSLDRVFCPIKPSDVRLGQRLALALQGSPIF